MIYMIGSVRDGIADLLTGIWAERGRPAYARVVGYGAIPLWLAFPLPYFAPPFHGIAFVLGLLVAQIAFRSLYALVNISYAAWSVWISRDSRDRAAIAGLRMLFGTFAEVVVSVSTERILLAVSCDATSTPSFLTAASGFAVIATPLLIHGARRSPQGADGRAVATSTPIGLGLVAIASTTLSLSTPYYFTYVVRNQIAGTTALALMGITGSVFVPLWMLSRHQTGSRSLWFGATALAVAGSIVFALTDTGAACRADLFLVTVQAALAAFRFVFWAMLPDTVEYGELHGGVRVGALSFGVAPLLQKVSIGAATAIIGFAYSATGDAPQVTQSAVVITDIRWIMVAAPILDRLLSVLAMAANPLRRDMHRQILAKLAERAAATPPT
ncbi:hypothetical protein E2E30_12825 [Sphingomonas sp. AAP5]|nr:hypothetical protein E2E30_12825 [Sphingomonas sp. AAP5]